MIYVGSTILLELYADLNPTLSLIFGLTSDASILSALGARVLLNLKVKNERDLGFGTSWWEKITTSAIDCAGPPSGAVKDCLDESTGTGDIEVIAA